jgi:hypothetical protein
MAGHDSSPVGPKHQTQQTDGPVDAQATANDAKEPAEADLFRQVVPRVRGTLQVELDKRRRKFHAQK